MILNVHRKEIQTEAKFFCNISYKFGQFNYLNSLIYSLDLVTLIFLVLLSITVILTFTLILKTCLNVPNVCILS